ncbi:LruC domain-containing protein, partial [Pseudoxanthomonas sp. SGD-10]
KQVNAIASTLNEPEPNCSSATRTISSNGNAGDINSGQVVAITANGANVSFNNLNGGTLLICATNVSISGINLNGTTVVVTSSGSANISNVNFNSSSSKIKNFGTLTINGNLTNQGEIANYGVLKLNHSLYSNNNPKFINTGSVTIESGSTIAGYFNNSGTITIKSGESSFNASQSSFNSGTILVDASKLNVSGAITNTGTIQARELNFTGSSDIKNHCKMISTTSIIIDAKVINYSFISAGTHTDLRANLQLEAGSIYKTKSVNTFDRTVLGSSTNPGLFKSEQAIAVNVNANPAFSGKLSVCGADAMATSKFTNGAVKDCNLYIPANNCTEGNGTAPKPVVKDTDGDGVADDLDAFPTDATKAFKHYSLNYANHGSSLAFEDNWPYKGDYDLNDIVLTYRYMIVTNSQNKVVRIEADYKLLATGGAFRNGAGVQFNIPSTSAKNFTGPQGTYLENGQDSIVVILFENSRNEQPTWNTDLSQAASEVKQYSIGFDIENGPLISVLGIGVYNPFIWNSTSGYGRGFETHLLGKAPTKKADISLFGTGDDNSVVGRKYSTKDNLPYALEIPTAPFEYPLERVAITDAYLNFADWASSAGATAEEWYNQVEG